MTTAYIISAFMEVEAIQNPSIDTIKELRKVGNLFESYDEALRALQRVKKALKEK